MIGRRYLSDDPFRLHHGKIIKVWPAQNEAVIQLFYLPAYSPELDPDEYLNYDLAVAVHSVPSVRSIRQLKNKVLSYMRKLQKIPKRVSSWFQHLNRQCAA